MYKYNWMGCLQILDKDKDYKMFIQRHYFLLRELLRVVGWTCKSISDQLIWWINLLNLWNVIGIFLDENIHVMINNVACCINFA